MIDLPRRAPKPRETRRKQQALLMLSDYQYPGEKQHCWTSVGVVVLVSFWIAGLAFYYTEAVEKVTPCGQAYAAAGF